MKEITELNDSNFESNANSSDIPVIVDFYSNSCPPCSAMEPAFLKLSEIYSKNAKFFKFNVDKNFVVPSSRRILGIPTIIIFKKGKEAERLTGFQSYESLEKFIRRNL
ncbi:MAG: thioredoxin family protein [Candidatus Aminicenantia bacterium]